METHLYFINFADFLYHHNNLKIHLFLAFIHHFLSLKIFHHSLLVAFGIIQCKTLWV